MQADPDETYEAAARVGRTLRDKWHLDALIDVGGMAAVYAATHRNGMRGAVKILHHHRSIEPDIAARFRSEGYIANKVAHPNAVRVLDDDVDDDGSLFLVMELLEGSTLRERAEARGGQLPADEVLVAVDQLLDVLALAHDVGIVHRDVKPENLFASADGQIKILDFGIARLSRPYPGRHSETMSGMPMGSPSYMSPEQARGRWDIVDARSDVWSVGATMFNLLSGEDVHAARTVPELLAEIFSTQARSLAVALPDCHPALAAVVDGALRLDLAERWADARAMQAAVGFAYRTMFGAELPRCSRAASIPPASPVAGDAIGNGYRPGTTVVTSKRTARARSLMPSRRIAASLVLLAAAGALGVGVWSRDSRSQEPPAAEGAVAELGEATTTASRVPARPSAATLAPPSAAAAMAPATGPAPQPARPSAAPAPVAPPLASIAPVNTPAPRRSTIYDRRY